MATATAEPARLPNTACDAVMLTVPNVAAAATGGGEDGQNRASFLASDTHAAPDASGTYAETGLEIFYGFVGNCVHQLFPLDKPVLLGVSNLDEIYVRCANGAARAPVAFSCFRKKKGDK